MASPGEILAWPVRPGPVLRGYLPHVLLQDMIRQHGLTDLLGQPATADDA
mgnify:CR=1 FL=1